MKLLNCCIVCYTHVDSSSLTRNEKEECVTARFIRLFQKHVRFSLESNQLKIRNSSLTFLSRNESDNQLIRFQVCETCSRLLSSFNSSYRDLKCAETRANWSLQQIANVIHFADFAPARRAKVRESLHDLEEDKLLVDNAVEIISKFRTQLQHKCRVWYKNQFTRVVLLRTKPGEVSTENMKEYENPDDECFASPAAKSKSLLIATALKNLSSLQLVLYLALLNPDLISNTDYSIPYTETTDRLQEPKNNFCCEEETTLSLQEVFPKECQGAEAVFECDHSINHSTEHKSSVEGSPASPQSLVIDADDGDGMDVEWEPGDDVECFQLEDHEALKIQNPKTSSRARLRAKFKCNQCIKTFSSRLQRDNHSKEQHDYTECSPPSSPPPPICSSNDTGRDHEWNPGDGVNCSGSEQQNVHSPEPCSSRNVALNYATDSQFYTICGCGEQFETQEAVRNHQSQCHLYTFTEQRPYSMYLTQDDGIANDQADPNCDFSHGAPGACDDTQTPPFTEDRPPDIENMTAPICLRCQSQFDSVEKLERHLANCFHNTQRRTRSATSGGRVAKYRCGKCGNRCKDLAVLYMHKLKHSAPGGKQHCCSYCGAKFIRFSAMTRHMRIHTGERPCKCPVDGCSKNFQRKDHLNLHLKMCHNYTRTTEVSWETQTQ